MSNASELPVSRSGTIHKYSLELYGMVTAILPQVLSHRQGYFEAPEIRCTRLGGVKEGFNSGRSHRTNLVSTVGARREDKCRSARTSDSPFSATREGKAPPTQPPVEMKQEEYTRAFLRAGGGYCTFLCQVGQISLWGSGLASRKSVRVT